MDTKDKAIAAFKKGKISMWDRNAGDDGQGRYPHFIYISKISEVLEFKFEGYDLCFRERNTEIASPFTPYPYMEYFELLNVSLSYDEQIKLAEYATIQARMNDIRSTPKGEQMLNEILEIPA